MNMKNTVVSVNIPEGSIGKNNVAYTATTLFTNQGFFQDELDLNGADLAANIGANNFSCFEAYSADGAHLMHFRAAAAETPVAAPQTSGTRATSKTFDATAQIPAGIKHQSLNSNIYVASLPENFTDAALYALFAPFGRILSAKVMCRKGTSACKGYGFVLFEFEESAARAQAEMIGFVVGGNKIQVRRARVAASTPLIDTNSMAMVTAPTTTTTISSNYSFSRHPIAVSASSFSHSQPLVPSVLSTSCTNMSSGSFIMAPQQSQSQLCPQGFCTPSAAASVAHMQQHLQPVYWQRGKDNTPVVYMMVPLRQDAASNSNQIMPF